MSLQCSGACPRLATYKLLSTTVRPFSTTPSILSNNVPPESPAYIRLPAVPQAADPETTRVRGRLPIPRNIFPREEGSRKVQPTYLQQTAPERAVDVKPENDVQKWKLEMANTRRHNLQSGLEKLWVRHKRVERNRTQQLRHQLAEQRK